MFIFRPTKFAAIYSLGNILSLCRWEWLGAGVGSSCCGCCRAMSCLPPFPMLTCCPCLLSLCSTMFLMGPWTQVKRMFDKTRW